MVNETMNEAAHSEQAAAVGESECSALLSAAVRAQCMTLPDDPVVVAGSDFDAMCFAAEHAKRLQKGFDTLARYFTSGNDVPVTEARIKAADFWAAFSR